MRDRMFQPLDLEIPLGLLKYSLSLAYLIHLRHLPGVSNLLPAVSLMRIVVYVVVGTLRTYVLFRNQQLF